MSDPRWLDAEATAQYISVRIDALPRLVRQGRIPEGCERQGRHGLWWNSSAIDEKFLDSSAYIGRGAKPRNLFLTPAADIIGAAQPWPKTGSGIYFLIKDGNVVYVGQSIDVVARVSQHQATKDFDSWHWVHCDFSELDQTERAYIDALQPHWNKDARTIAMRNKAAA